MSTENKKRKAEDALNFLQDLESAGSDSTEQEKRQRIDTDELAAPVAPKAFEPSGFAAYAKINPFTAAASNARPSFGGFGGFGNGSQPGFALSSSGAGSLMNSRPNFTMPTPLVVPSPKSPKHNPFSSPSPAHNPFMTIVESKDELWKTMANDKLTEEDLVKSHTIFNKTLSSGNKRSRLLTGDAANSFSTMENNDQPVTNNDISQNKEGGADDEEGDEVSDTDAGTTNNNNTADEAVFTKTYALPENVTVITGEEQELCLLQTRAKLYRLVVNSHHATSSSSSSKGNKAENMEWIEVGVGPLKVLEHQETVNSTAADYDKNGNDQEGVNSVEKKLLRRLVMRREDKKGGLGTKLLLNVRFDQYTTPARQGDKMLRLLCFNFAEDSAAGSNSNKPASSSGSSSSQQGLDAVGLLGTSAVTPITSAVLTPQTYLLKTKESKDCDDILQLMDEAILSSKSLTTTQSQNDLAAKSNSTV